MRKRKLGITEIIVKRTSGCNRNEVATQANSCTHVFISSFNKYGVFTWPNEVIRAVAFLSSLPRENA